MLMHQYLSLEWTIGLDKLLKLLFNANIVHGSDLYINGMFKLSFLILIKKNEKAMNIGTLQYGAFQVKMYVVYVLVPKV